RQSRDESPHTAAQTKRGSGGNTSTAGVAGCVGAVPESIAAGPHAGWRQVAVCNDAIEVLVEATQHRRQLTLLVSSLPVPMPESHSLVRARNLRQLFRLGRRTTANLPRRSVPHTCVKPKKSNLSGRSSYVAFRSAA